MNLVLNVIMAIFWLLLLYYSYLTIAGILDRYGKKGVVTLNEYPSVAVLIPHIMKASSCAKHSRR
nr:hypothetical protein [Exiguobacterium sp. SL14]